MFQSDGHNPIDLSAFRAEAAPPPVAARPRLRFPRARRPQAPVAPEPPTLPKLARAPKPAKPAKEPKARDKEKDRPVQPPIATPPPGTWPPGAIPQQVSLPASIAYVVWMVLVAVAVAAFYVVKFVFQLALLPFMRMLD